MVTLPDQDVRNYQPPPRFHGVLAAPPCTEFACCGARWWATKPPERLLEALEIVWACIRLGQQAAAWWALENPVGRLVKWLGPPKFRFQPWEFGDPWTKQTWLWGRFTPPRKLKNPIKPNIGVPGHRSAQWQRTLTPETLIMTNVPPNWIHLLGPRPDRAALRAITPPRFAQAFFEANP